MERIVVKESFFGQEVVCATRKEAVRILLACRRNQPSLRHTVLIDGCIMSSAEIDAERAPIDLSVLRAIRDVYKARFHALLSRRGVVNYAEFEAARDEYRDADAVYLSALLEWNAGIVAGVSVGRVISSDFEAVSK